MPPKKKLPKSRTAGAVMDAVARMSATHVGSDRFLLLLSGVTRVFDSKSHVQNDEGSVTIHFSRDSMKQLHEDLGLALEHAKLSKTSKARTLPQPGTVEAAMREIEAEDRAARERERSPEREAIVAENDRRSQLPSWHPEHSCGVMCDGQDGANSFCARLRRKLFGDR